MSSEATSTQDVISHGTVPGKSPSMPASAVKSGRFGLSALLGAALLLVVMTRWPLLPAQLYSFDAVNFALALEEFDPNLNQPQPPGYPLFVLEARLFALLFRTPELAFAAIQMVVSALCLLLIYALGKRVFSAYAGLIAAGLLFVNPAFWYSSLTSPLRPHLALFSLLVAHLLWRAREGVARYYYVASAVLGLAGGFRPELPLVLFPLWAWAGWRCGRWRILWQGGAILALTTAVWIGALVALSGGPSRLLFTVREYFSAQTFQTSALEALFAPGWRRMLGRAILWNGLGMLAMAWTLPFLWSTRNQWPEWKQTASFALLWFVPAFLFSVLVHIADPDHALTTVPVVCLIGGACIAAAERSLQGRTIEWLKNHSLSFWLLLPATIVLLLAESPPPLALAVWIAAVILIWRLLPRRPGAWRSQICLLLAFVLGITRLGAFEVAMWSAIAVSLLFLLPTRSRRVSGALACAALLANIWLFSAKLPFPQGPAGGQFRGIASARDAFLGATYESSYNRVAWTNEMTSLAVENIPRIKQSTRRPLILIWSRDGTPVWRKLAYYFPAERIYALDEGGDPGVPVSQARLWSGNRAPARYTGNAPIHIPIPRGARLVWFVAGNRLKDLQGIVPLRHSNALHYSDLPDDFPPFQWGSFEFVPQ